MSEKVQGFPEKVPKQQMEDPKFRQKHVAKDKKKDKGPIFASQKHVRIELENQWRHEKRKGS